MFTTVFHCLKIDYNRFLLVTTDFTLFSFYTLFCKCFKLFYKRLQLFSTVLQGLGFVLSLFYLATINGCQCDNALQEESLTIKEFTIVFHCLQVFTSVLHVFTTVFHSFTSVYNCFASVSNRFTSVFETVFHFFASV